MSIGNIAEQLELNYVGLGIRKISQLIRFGDFTDDGSDAIGDVIMNTTIPAGSFILGCKATVKTGFTGDTTATMKVGTSKDAGDISGNTTINVLAAARNLVRASFISSDAGLIAVSSTQTVYVGVTGGADFGSISAGLMLVEVYYFSTNVELTSDHPTEVSLNNA